MSYPFHIDVSVRHEVGVGRTWEIGFRHEAARGASNPSTQGPHNTHTGVIAFSA